MATETVAANGPFISAQLVTDLLVTPLLAQSVVLSAGPKLINSNQPVRIPRITGGPTPAYVAEGGAIPEGNITTDEITALPSTLQSVKQIIRVSEELVRSSSVAVSPVFTDTIVTAVASKLDTDMLTGTGASNTVKGLTNITGASTSVLDVEDADSLLDAIGVAYSHEIRPTHWFVSGHDFISLRKLKDTTGRYLIESDITADVTYRLHGIPVVVTNKLASGKALLVDVTNIVAVVDQAPDVQILTELYAGTGEVGIKVSTRYDIAALRNEAVTVLTAA